MKLTKWIKPGILALALLVTPSMAIEIAPELGVGYFVGENSDNLDAGDKLGFPVVGAKVLFPITSVGVASLSAGAWGGYVALYSTEEETFFGKVETSLRTIPILAMAEADFGPAFADLGVGVNLWKSTVDFAGNKGSNDDVDFALLIRAGAAIPVLPGLQISASFFLMNASSDGGDSVGISTTALTVGYSFGL